jgi:hypothetical protein
MYQELSIKCLRKIELSLFIMLAACYLMFVASPSAQAQTMSNQNYILRTDNLNTVANTTTEDDKSKSATEKIDQAISEGVNFKTVAGFKDLSPDSVFTITLSSDIIDFGALSPTNPIIRFVDLNIYSLNSHGYSVLAFENQPLTAINQGNKAIIPDATCDNGGCGTENADRWTNTLTYGFGYRCDNLIGTMCDNSFIKAYSYKRFPDIANNDDYQSIMSGFGSDKKKARIFYKVNISGAQAQGNYNNTITYLGVPNF